MAMIVSMRGQGEGIGEARDAHRRGDFSVRAGLGLEMFPKAGVFLLLSLSESCNSAENCR